MKRFLPAEELARDERFLRVGMTAQMSDPRAAARRQGAYSSGEEGEEKPSRPGGRLSPLTSNGPDRARGMMHGIFVGEIQALEGAGRTTFDFDEADAPFALKLDMARQCWDESRHVEISIKLCDWMGTDIGEFAENTFLYQAACNPDPVLRLTGVNRALEGLAIDVFHTMREFAGDSGDPVLGFAEDWMLADEVTHVKMGSDWLRRLTATDPERRERAIEFQRVVDGLFSGGGFRRDDPKAPIRLARRFRELAGFTGDEIDEIAEISEAQAVKAGVERHVTAKFEGFPEAAFRFYEELEADNSKAFWQAHKDVYETACRAPMEALMAELESEFGPGKLFRPYRDVRFSLDKTPYKTNLAAVVSGGGYLSLSPDGLYIGGGGYMLDGPALHRYRVAVASDAAGPELERIVATLEKKGYEVGGPALKGAPKGFSKGHERIRFLRHKGVHGGKEFPVEPWLHTRAALAKVQKVMRDLKPLREWHDIHVGESMG